MGQRVPVTAQRSTCAGTRQIPNIWRQNRRVRSVRGRRWTIAGLMLVQRLRRWSSIKRAVGHRSWLQGCTYPSITGRPAGSANESGCRRAGSVPAIHRAGLSPALQLARGKGGEVGEEGRGGYKTTCRTTNCIQCVKPDVKRSTCSPFTVTYNTPVCVLYYSFVRQRLYSPTVRGLINIFVHHHQRNVRISWCTASSCRPTCQHVQCTTTTSWTTTTFFLEGTLWTPLRGTPSQHSRDGDSPRITGLLSFLYYFDLFSLIRPLYTDELWTVYPSRGPVLSPAVKYNILKFFKCNIALIIITTIGL